MRIAFDLDNTLIPTTEFACGSSVAPFPLRLFFKERLRNGAIELLQEITKKHELWIYTTSYRGPMYIKSWFWSRGIKLNYVVNQSIHDNAVNENVSYSKYSKAPKLFGIELLIDDLPGVGIECEDQGCDFIIIHPLDKNWVEKIKSKIML